MTPIKQQTSWLFVLWLRSKEVLKIEKLNSEIRRNTKILANKIFQIFYFCGNQLQRFTNLHLGLYASSPRKAAGYFAAIPLPLIFDALLNLSNTICLFFFLTDKADTTDNFLLRKNWITPITPFRIGFTDN